jgi:hypothetical protein
MQAEQHYSGSSGNLYTITGANGNRMLIEAGVTWSKLQQALEYDLTNIEGCLISHGGHKDHSKAINDVRRAGIDVYASEDSFNAHKLSGSRNTYPVSNKTLLRLDSFEVFCFDVHHDVPTLGFIVREKSTNEFLFFCTDTSHITQRFKHPFSIIMIEVSYDLDWLTQRVEDKDINEVLAKRLLTSHMEKQNAMDYIDYYCDISKCRQIHLLHCSGDNMDKEKVRIEFEKKFFIETRTVACRSTS